jgi:hypothetical protein
MSVEVRSTSTPSHASGETSSGDLTPATSAEREE